MKERGEKVRDKKGEREGRRKREGGREKIKRGGGTFTCSSGKQNTSCFFEQREDRASCRVVMIRQEIQVVAFFEEMSMSIIFFETRDVLTTSKESEWKKKTCICSGICFRPRPR